MSADGTIGAGAGAERARLLRLMDLNFVEMYRQHVRHVSGGEAHDYESVTVIHGPGGAAKVVLGTGLNGAGLQQQRARRADL